MTGHFLMGLDGGGTKTKALLADISGNVLGRGESGPSNYHAVGVDAAFAALEEAVCGAWLSAGLKPQAPAAACLGMAGVDRPADHQMMQHWAEQFFNGAHITICNDAYLVLAAGTPDEYGLAIISGTGSIVHGRDHQGRLARAGGWGYLLGDEGSGYAIGLQALRTVTRACDERAAETALTQAILSAWSLEDPTELIPHVYSSTLQRSDVARLAVLVDQAAALGDPAAQAIITEAGRELALGARAVVKKLGLSGRVPCALAGGTIVKGHCLAEAFRHAAAEFNLQLGPLQKVEEPVTGALRIAVKEMQLLYQPEELS